MRERVVITTAVAILTVMLILTLTPLLLMFYTSLRPTGNLLQRATEVMVADFEVGALNSIGGPIIVQAEGTSQVEKVFEPLEAEANRNRVMTIHYSKGTGTAQWTTRISQDMRKFAFLEFRARGKVGGETFTIDLIDLKGRRTSLGLREFHRGGLTTQWETIRIPINTYHLDLLSPGLPERLAEDLAINFKEGRGTIYLDDIRLTFKNWTLNNYRDVLFSGPFGRYGANSLGISLIVTFGNLLFATMVGYAFARRYGIGGDRSHVHGHPALVIIEVKHHAVRHPGVVYIPVYMCI